VVKRGEDGGSVGSWCMVPGWCANMGDSRVSVDSMVLMRMARYLDRIF
jgi:hypothetical protein